MLGLASMRFAAGASIAMAHEQTELDDDIVARRRVLLVSDFEQIIRDNDRQESVNDAERSI